MPTRAQQQKTASTAQYELVKNVAISTKLLESLPFVQASDGGEHTPTVQIKMRRPSSDADRLDGHV